MLLTLLILIIIFDLFLIINITRVQSVSNITKLSSAKIYLHRYEMNENVCRFCLQTITGNCQPIGKCVKDILKLNLSISKSAVKCIECTNNLEIFLKFKSACEYMTEETLSTGFKEDIDVDIKNIEITNNLLSLMESKKEARCTFCTKFKESESLTSINETKQHMFLVDVLKEHIPKLNLNIREELLTCETCLDGLQSVSSFVLNCLDVEQNINKYIKTKGTDYKGQIELKDVQRFVFNPTVKLEIESKDVDEVLKGKYDGFQEELTTGTQAEVKYETKIENPELVIKTEDINIKSEQSDFERFQESPILTKMASGSLDVLLPQKRCINQHDVTSNDQEEMARYECEADEVKHHLKEHKMTSALPIFKCNLCTYESKRKRNLERHRLIHKSTSEVTMFTCEICAFETKHQHYLKQHKLTHKSASEVTMFKCELCSYESKHLRALRRHVLAHKSPLEVTMFKCELCPFESKHSDSLKQHKLTHANASEVTMVKCEICAFETKHRHYLKKHKLIHKSPSEITMFKCELCGYETKHRGYIKQHKLIHKNTSEVTMFKCDTCAFETKRKVDLKRHTLIHKSPSEMILFKCELCSFETKHKQYLKEHKVRHKSTSELTLFRCDLCSYKAKYKYYVERHKLIHKSTTM